MHNLYAVAYASYPVPTIWRNSISNDTVSFQNQFSTIVIIEDKSNPVIFLGLLYLKIFYDHVSIQKNTSHSGDLR